MLNLALIFTCVIQRIIKYFVTIKKANAKLLQIIEFYGYL